MSGELERTELQRERWWRARAPLGLVDPESAEDFAGGGLARHVDDFGVRLLILPSDPVASVVRFDEGFWEWWMHDRLNPFEGAAPTDWGTQSTPTVEAAVRFHHSNGKWKWGSYLALHRSGALEFELGELGFGISHPQEGETHRGFYLSTIVGRTWVALFLYGEVRTRYPVLQGPWEITLALSKTRGAKLGNVAAGWKDFGDWFPREAPRCPEVNLLLRTEVGEWPDTDRCRDLAFDFGTRIEDAWGNTNHRFLIHEGHAGAGTFDVSRYA